METTEEENIQNALAKQREQYASALKKVKKEIRDVKHRIHPSSQIAVKRIIDKCFGDLINDQR